MDKIPLYLFDEHNDAFYYWQKARFAGCIDSSIDLFHIDAHNDMSKPHRFRQSLYPGRDVDILPYYKNFARQELTIANFIFPAVLCGIIKNVYFFYPAWRSFKPARVKIRVGSVFGEGNQIRYPTWLAGGRRKITVDKALPDLKMFTYKASPIERMPTNRKVILDIDLDYFSCCDTVQNNWKFRLAVTNEQYRQAHSFLMDETIPFSGLEFNFIMEKNKPAVIISFKKIEDKSYLPERREIDKSIDILIGALSKHAIKPAVITICRSRISGFTPSEYIGYIENLLVRRLSEIYSLQINNA